MRTKWLRVLHNAAFSGGMASALSALMLAWRGKVDLGSGAAPLNAPAHWLDQRALGQNRASMHYTTTGMVIHHLSSIFWACFYELAAGRRRRDAATALRDAAAISAVAALVDCRLVPQRLTPGFDSRLTRRSLTWVYAAFAVGLFIGTRLNDAGGRSDTRSGRGKSSRLTLPPSA